MKLLLPIPCRSCEGFSHFEYLAYLWTIKRADERTRTTDLTSLGVITQALQGCAEACKSRIFRRLPLLRVAACCTVLRSRWCQRGVKRPQCEHRSTFYFRILALPIRNLKG